MVEKGLHRAGVKTVKYFTKLLLNLQKLLLFFLSFLIWDLERQRRVLPSVASFPECLQRMDLGWVQNWELGTQSRSPRWMAETQPRGQNQCFPRSVYWQAAEDKDPRPSSRGCRCSNQGLNHCSECLPCFSSLVHFRKVKTFTLKKNHESLLWFIWRMGHPMYHFSKNHYFNKN